MSTAAEWQEYQADQAERQANATEAMARTVERMAKTVSGIWWILFLWTVCALIGAVAVIAVLSGA